MKQKMLAIGLVTSCLFTHGVMAENTTLFTNVDVFDGVHEKLIKDANVLIEGNKIKKISRSSIKQSDAEVIDGSGHTLMPGLIDAHYHITITQGFESLAYDRPQIFVGALAAKSAEDTLNRGFTTVRDAGGPSQGLQMAIDEGYIQGPRILSSGAFISQTAGHGDFDTRRTYLSPYFNGNLDKAEIFGYTKIADGVAEVRKATREVLRSGVAQIKIFGSGSVTGAHDPIDVSQFTFDELKAIVEEAENWGTYAMVHAYTNKSLQTAIKAGVKSVEHAQFASEETIKLMKKNDVYLSTQVYGFSLDPYKIGMKGETAEKYLEVQKNSDTAIKLAKKYGVKIAFGTDAFGSLPLLAMQPRELLARTKYFTPYEILVQATSSNAELLERSGKRHPYREGALGVIDEGAYADVLLVKGNPLEDISLLTAPNENLSVIMKDGKFVKNTL